MGSGAPAAYADSGIRWSDQAETIHLRRFVLQLRRNWSYRAGVWLPTSTSTVTRASGPARANGAQASGDAGGCAYLKMNINKEPHLCLLDSGCEITVVPTRLVNLNEVKPSTQLIRAANGTAIPVLGAVTLQGYIGKRRLSIEGLVSSHVQEPMLGMDWLQKHAVTWLFQDNRVWVGEYEYRTEARHHDSTWIRRVVLSETTVLPPRSECDVQAGVVCWGRTP